MGFAANAQDTVKGEREREREREREHAKYGGERERERERERQTERERTQGVNGDCADNAQDTVKCVCVCLCTVKRDSHASSPSNLCSL
jgi:hypothetical protein